MTSTVYSKFGTQANNESGTYVGQQGEPGIGFTLTPGGDYDILDKSFENVDNIQLKSISAVASIEVNSPMDMNANTLTVQDLKIDSIATDNALTDILVLDGSNKIKKRTTFPNPFDQSLNTTDSPSFVEMEAEDIILTDGTAVKSATHQLHIQQETGNAKIFLENSGNGGSTHIDMNQEYGSVASQILHRHGPVSCLEFRAGQVVNNWGMIEFYISQTNNAPKGTMNTFTTDHPLLRMGGTGSLNINMYEDVLFNNKDLFNINALELESITANTTNILMNSPVDMGTNSIINANDITLESITAGTSQIVMNNAINMFAKDILNVNELDVSTMASISGAGGNIAYLSDINMTNNDILDVGAFRFQTTPTTDNTNSDLLTVDGSGNIEIRTVASLPNPNLWDQNLNTTDDVQFDDIQLGTISGATSGTAITVSADSTSVSLGPAVQLGVQNAIQIVETPLPSLPGGFGHKIYRRLGSVKALNSAGTEFDLINNFNQTLNTFDSVEFTNLNLSTIAKDTGSTKLLTIDGSDDVKYRDLTLYEYAESLTFSSTTTTVSFTTKLSHTTAVLPIGTYEVSFGCLITNSKKDIGTQVNFEADASNLNGEAIDKPKSPFDFAYHSVFHTYRVVYGTATIHNYKILYRPINDTGGIRDAKISIKQIL